jgi:putative DNA primase/helicase
VTSNATGKWKSILTALGIPEKVLDGKHHPCPCTGEGEDRFRFANRNGKGSFFCGCNDGRSDGFQLLKCKFGMDFKAAAEAVEKIIGKATDDDEESKKSPEVALRALKSIQSKLAPVGKEVGNYLRNRGFYTQEIPSTLREAKLNYALGPIQVTGYHHAMVAKFVTKDGKPCTFHVTYVEDGQKAKHSRQRVIATPTCSMAGGAVRLFPIHEGILGIAEGIETAMAARAIYNVPTWASLNAAMMEAFEPPEEVTKLVIFADNDKNYAGHKAAYALAHRLAMKRSNIDVDVVLPLLPGEDFNDELRRERNGH